MVSLPPKLLLQLLLLLWTGALTASVRAATLDEISTLKEFASKIHLAPDVWDFNQDPCTGQWFGICCCDNSSTCPVDDYTPDKSSCSRRANATVVGVFLDVNYKSSIPPLNGTISESVCRLKSLVKLVVSNNPLHGEIPACIGQLSQLRYFQAVGGYLTGRIPKELGSLRSLKFLWLGYNLLSGDIPATLGNLQELESFAINSNQLTGRIPPVLGRMRNLIIFRVHSNLLSGSIPNALANLTKLKDFWLHNNELSGEIDKSIFQNMSSLENIYLHCNNFNGRVPEVQIQNLEQLRLGFNRLSGPIPESLSKLPFIKEISLGHNNLSGTIPSSFAKLSSIKVLDVSHNSLTGTLENLPPQAAVDFSFNHFSTQNLKAGLVSQEDTGESFFNCPAPKSSQSCLQSSVGELTSSAIVAGRSTSVTSGNTLFQPDANRNSTGLYYFGDSKNWALELGGSNTNQYTSTETVHDIPANENPELYQSMRWSSTYLAYHLRNLKNGEYLVTMHFAETLLPEPTFRVFDVVVQGTMVRKKLDVVHEAGAFAAYRILHNTTVSSGILSVELIGNGGDRYLNPNKYSVQKQGPMISAINVETLDKNVDKKDSPKLVISITIPVIAGALVIILLTGLWYWCLNKGGRKSIHGGLLKSYTYKELHKATEGFSEKSKLGEGAFGKVYLGRIKGKVVAVKKIETRDEAARRRFKQEVQVLSSVQHKNLVGIWGFCDEGVDSAMLVCDYMAGGNVEEKRADLGWDDRVRIAVGCAQGLAYLHERRIVHCDVKPKNILLDHRRSPRISDFGMAHLLDSQSHLSLSRAGGTVGYLAPEYAIRNEVTDKVDVYSFGVVLLELVSGRRAIEREKAESEVVLAEWAAGKAAIGELVSVVNLSSISGSVVVREAERMAVIGLHCTRLDAADRPSMRRVWLMLTGVDEVPALPALIEYPEESRIEDSLFNLYPRQ